MDSFKISNETSSTQKNRIVSGFDSKASDSFRVRIGAVGEKHLKTVLNRKLVRIRNNCRNLEYRLLIIIIIIEEQIYLVGKLCSIF